MIHRTLTGKQRGAVARLTVVIIYRRGEEHSEGGLGNHISDVEDEEAEPEDRHAVTMPGVLRAIGEKAEED